MSFCHNSQFYAPFVVQYVKHGDFMDITLERILKLIPQKKDGRFVHGAISAFAKSIGFANGNVVSDWIAGRNKSYFDHLYEISAKYHVSVAYLRGETDDPEIKTPAAQGDGRVAEFEQAVNILFADHPESLLRLLDALAVEPEKTKAKFDLFLATL